MQNPSSGILLVTYEGFFLIFCTGILLVIFEGICPLVCNQDKEATTARVVTWHITLIIKYFSEAAPGFPLRQLAALFVVVVIACKLCTLALSF